MEKKPDIFSLAQYALNFAEKEDSNLKCAEVYFGKSKYINIEIEENSIKNSEIGSDYGVSFRLINNKGSFNENGDCGIYLNNSHGNDINWNTAKNNKYGIYLNHAHWA